MKDKCRAVVEKAITPGALEAKLIDTDQIVFDPRSHSWGNIAAGLVQLGFGGMR